MVAFAAVILLALLSVASCSTSVAEPKEAAPVQPALAAVRESFGEAAAADPHGFAAGQIRCYHVYLATGATAPKNLEGLKNELLGKARTAVEAAWIAEMATGLSVDEAEAAAKRLAFEHRGENMRIARNAILNARALRGCDAEHEARMKLVTIFVVESGGGMVVVR